MNYRLSSGGNPCSDWCNDWCSNRGGYINVKMILVSCVALLLTACASHHVQDGKPKDGQHTVHAQSAQPSLSAYADQRDFCPKVSADTLNTCTAQGGSLQKQGKAQCYACTIEYSDAGKVCTGSADCQGGCYNYGESLPINVPNQVGQCAKNNVRFGCHQRIEGGRAANGMLCVD